MDYEHTVKCIQKATLTHILPTKGTYDDKRKEKRKR